MDHQQDKHTPCEVEAGEIVTNSPTSEKRRCFSRYQRLLPGLIIACLGIYKCSEALLKTSTRLYILFLACMSVTNNVSTCRYQKNPRLGLEKETETARIAAPFISCYTILFNGSAIIPCLFLGSWSDSNGRKAVILLALFGQILACITFSFSYIPGIGYIPGAAIFIQVGVLIYGCLGKSAGFLVGASSYVTDCSTIRQRTRLLSRLIGVGFVGNCCGFALQSLLSLFITFRMTILSVCATAIILFLVILIFVKESVIIIKPLENGQPPQVISNGKIPNGTVRTVNDIERCEALEWNKEGKDERSGLCFTMRHIINYLTKKRERNERGHIITLLICCFISHMVKVGELDALFFYVFRERVGWSSTLYGAYQSASYIAMSFQLLLVYPLLEKFFKPSDETCIIIGASIKVVALAATGLTYRTSLIFTYGLLSSFGAFVGCASRSTLTKLTSDDETGVILSITSLLEVIASTIGSGIFTNIYVQTANSTPGLVFFVLSGLEATTVLSIVLFRFYVLRNNMHAGA